MSDHPTDDHNPYQELKSQLSAGCDSVDGAFLIRLDDDDFAAADAAGSPRWPHAVRVSIDRAGFLSPGRWKEHDRLQCHSGRLRIGHRYHDNAAVMVSSPKGADWILETYVEADYGSTIGMRARRMA